MKYEYDERYDNDAVVDRSGWERPRIPGEGGKAVFDVGLEGLPFELDEPRPEDLFDDSVIGPPGQFYSKSGDPISPPLSTKAEPPSSANQYGYLLNGYGERGARLVWLAYTAGTRQAF